MVYLSLNGLAAKSMWCRTLELCESSGLVNKFNNCDIRSPSGAGVFMSLQIQFCWRLVWAATLVLLSGFASGVNGHTATGEHGMVATVHPLASRAAVEAFEKGGYAIDAAVAAAVTLGVVDGHNSGLGGGCFVLVYRKDGTLIAIDGREMAPAAATRDMYLRDGKADTSLSQNGPLAVGVPGAVAAYDLASREMGKLPLAAALQSAADIAEQGFPIDRNYARNIRNAKEWLGKFPASRAMLLKENGEPYEEGETLRLPDLAKTYRGIAEHGTGWFYRGAFAKTVGDWMAANGGVLTAEDFAKYQPKKRQPVRTTYRDHEIIGFSPPSSGGVHVGQILNILESFDLKAKLQSADAAEESAGYHFIAEAMKLAFADRAHWLGDPDFAKVPRGLTDQSYADGLAAKIGVDRLAKVDAHGLPDDWQSNVYGKHTTHIATADSEGNWVAITATVNTTFGSKVTVPGTGLILNNEMDDFSAQPGVPNAFGLLGAEANAVEPGKRPLSSMSPTIVLKDGKPVMTVGAAGGPKIITQAVLAIINFVDREMPLDECVAKPRLHHQWRPDRLLIEKGFPEAVVEGLKSRGHEIKFLNSCGITQAICRTDDGKLVGVADPRVQGQAIGFTKELVTQ